MFRSAYHTISGGLTYAKELFLSDTPRGRFQELPPIDAKLARLIVVGWLAPGSSGDTLATQSVNDEIPAFTYHVGFKALRSYNAVYRDFERFIDRVRQERSQIERFEIISHSMGGLLTCDSIRRGVFNGLRCSVVTLGTMHQGTNAAVFGMPFSLSAYQLHPKHPRFRRQRAPGRLSHVPLLSIAGRHDLIVPPSQCQLPYEAYGEFLEVDADHGTLLRHRRIYREAHRFLLQSRDRATVIV